MRTLTISLVALLLSCTTPALAAREKAPLVLQPSSDWSLRATDERCRLTRTFGDGANKTLVRIDRFEPGRTHIMLIAGPPIAEVNMMDVSLAFGPYGRSGVDRLSGVSVGNYKPGFQSSDIIMSDQDGADISWVDVVSRARRTIRLELGPMADPLADLTTCSDALAARWGFDPVEQKTLASSADPVSSPAEWLDAGDYPRDLLKQGAQGIVRFRLDVDATGAATACHVQEATDPPGFAEAVCAALMKHAKFTPARSADGKPVRSYYANTVRFDAQRL